MSEVNAGLDPVAPRRAYAGTGFDEEPGRGSAVSWAAIFAGAAGAAALSLLLLILGTGLGLSSVSPWTMQGISAATFGIATIVWLTFTQLAASGMGGYLAGRLRTKWTAVHTDEVFFRDTAHGFLSWAVAALLTAAVLTSVAGSIVSGGVSAGAAVAGGTASAVGSVAGTAAGSAATLAAGQAGSDDAGGIVDYFVDSLFRGDPDAAADEPARQAPQGAAGDEAPDTAADDEAESDDAAPQQETQRAAERVREMAREVAEIPTGEIVRIFANALRTGTLPEADERHVARLIAERTDLSRQEAQERVSEVFDEVQSTLEDAETAAREAADEARAASAYAALWLFVTLLIGAFAASLMAVFGGRQRDA